MAQPRRPRGIGQGRMRGPWRRSPRPPAQPRSGRSPWQRARGGEGPGGVGCRGCYFCCFLFLAATSPWQRCYSPRPLPGSVGARDPGRPRPLVSHLLGYRSSPWRPPPRHPGPVRASPAPHPSRLPSRLCRARGPGGSEIDGGRLLKKRCNHFRFYYVDKGALFTVIVCRAGRARALPASRELTFRAVPGWWRVAAGGRG